MSTATASNHHFPHPIALAAAATVVVVGGAAALGIAAAQDNAPTAPSHSSQVKFYPPHQQCPSNLCMPHRARGGSHNSRSIEESLPSAPAQVPPLVGGRIEFGQP